MKIQLCLTLLTVAAFAWAGEEGARYGILSDKRDINIYRTVKIGRQTWMAENLNYKTEKSVCYENKAENCKKYGRLYTWNDAIKACPKGWHLPSDEEWTELTDFVGGDFIAGMKLRSAIDWYGWYGGGKLYKPATDEYDFSALPGGSGIPVMDCSSDYEYPDPYFHHAGSEGSWWSAAEYDVNRDRSWCREMFYGSTRVRRDICGNASRFSVRCVRDD